MVDLNLTTLNTWLNKQEAVEHFDSLTDLTDWLFKAVSAESVAEAKRRGLVPQSGDWEKPRRWVLGEDADVVEELDAPRVYSYDEVKKFLDISEKSNAPLNKTLKAMLKRIGVVDNRITLTTLLNYLAREKGKEPVKKAIVMHHKRGLKGKTGSATRDLQLLRNINNANITNAEKNIRYSVEELGQEPDADDIKILKDNQARVMAGGKEYGFGPKTPGGALRKFEKFL